MSFKECVPFVNYDSESSSDSDDEEDLASFRRGDYSQIIHNINLPLLPFFPSSSHHFCSGDAFNHNPSLPLSGFSLGSAPAVSPHIMSLSEQMVG